MPMEVGEIMGIPILKIWNKAKQQYESILAIKGDKGDTPQKGVDYFTDTDKQELVDDVKNQVTIPTKVSAFDNDAGYLTEHQSLEGYATESWIEGKGYLTEHQSLAGYVKQSEVDSIVHTAVTAAMKANIPYTIGFGKGKLYAMATDAFYSATSYTDSSITFQYRGASGVEELLFPITGLYRGRQYTIVFDETYNGTFIQDTYRYGCGIIQESTYNSTTFPTGQATPSWVSWHTGSTGTQEGAITFTANSSTVYWAWSLGRLSDRKDVTITFNAKLV